MKILKSLSLFLLLSSNIIFAQKSDWGSWNTTPCFKGISFRVRIAENTLFSENRYKYEVEFKNNYTSTVSFSYLLTDQNSTNTLCKERIQLVSGATKIAWSLLSSSNNSTIRVYTEKACFEENGNCGQYNKQCYANCDNGIPNIPTDCNQTNKNQSSNTSQNSTGSSGTSSMNRGSNIVTEETSSNKIDTEKNQSYQQFKQNGEKLVKEQKFFEAKQEFQKSLQYSVNDSQIAYANKMIAFCDEYSKKNEKYDNVSKGIDIANDIINNISKKDNVFGKKTIDNSENLFKNNQIFQKIVNAINNNENVIVIKDCILNYFFELGFEIQNSYQTNDNLSFGYGFKNNIGMEVIKNPNKLIIQFPSDKNNFGKLMLKNLKNTNVIGKSILTNKYNIEYSPKNQIDLTNFSIDNQNTSSNNSLIEEIDAQKFNSNDMILKIKNYFEKLNYKYISTNNYSDDLSILKFEKFFISINSVSNYVSAISIDIPNENKHILNELKSKMITKKFKEKTIHQHSVALYYDVPLNQNINNNINNKLKFDNESYKTNLKKLQTDIQSFKNNKEKFKESLFAFFKNQNFNYFKTEIDNERGSINYYFNQNKSIGLIDYNNKLMLIFENENKNFGENLHKDLKSFDIAGFEKDNGKTYLIFFTFN